MNDTDLALARRALACKGWRWMDGMRAYDADGRCSFRLTESSGLPGHPDPVVDDGWSPDLSDAATRGCLLALVREAWGEPLLCAVPVDDGLWMVPSIGHGGLPSPIGIRYARTEAEALVAALEAACG